MVNIAGTEVPFNMSFAGLGTTVTIVLLLLVIAIIGGTGIFFFIRAKTYNRKIVDFENVSNAGYQPVFKDRARLIKIGDGGEEVLYLLKRKQYRTAYGKKMGKNIYWFAKGQDGYYYNVLLGDVDAKMGMLDIEPIDRDMRYMHVAIRKNIQDRYRKQNFMEKYGTYIMSGIFLIIMMAGIWFQMDKLKDISAESAKSIATAAEVHKDTASIIASLDNICGGSGLKPATG